MPLHCGEDMIDPARRVGSIAQDTSRILRDLLYPLSLTLVRHFVTQIYSSEPQEFQQTHSSGRGQEQGQFFSPHLK